MNDTKERPIHVGKSYTACPEKTKGQHFLDCEFYALDLTERDFSGSAFTDCLFEGVAADRGQWADTEFSYCKIRHSSFLSAILSRSTFTQCIGTKNDYRYAAFRSAVRIGGREDEPSIEGLDITGSLFDQFVLFLAKGSVLGIEKAVYTLTDGKPGAMYLYQKGMPLLFTGRGWTDGPGSRMKRVERMPETVQRYYQKFRNIRKSDVSAPAKVEKAEGEAGKGDPKERQVFGVFWDFRPTPMADPTLCTPPGKGLIYGYPSPDRSRLIQGWTVAVEDDWQDAVTRVTEGKGEMTCKYCDGEGDTLKDALKDAEDSWAEKEALTKLSGDVKAFCPKYRERILPNVFQRFQEAKDGDDGTLFQTLQLEDTAEDLFQHEADFLEKLLGRLRHGAYGKTPESIKAACHAMQEDNVPWNRKEARFDVFLEKADPFLYAPLKKRIAAYQEALDKEGLESRKGGLLSAYQDAVKTYFRSRRELRLAVLHLSMATGKSVYTCFLTLGARERAFFVMEALKDRYKRENQGKDHPLRAAIEELDAYFTPTDYVKRLAHWQIVCGVDVPKVQAILQRTDAVFFVTRTEEGFRTKDDELLPGTLSVRPIEYDERLHAMYILYPPKHKDTARSPLFPRTIHQEECKAMIAKMIRYERKDEL